MKTIARLNRQAPNSGFSLPVLLLLTLLLASSTSFANTDVGGLPVIGSGVVELRVLDDSVSGYAVLLSSAEKTGRELLTKSELRVAGARSRRLWQWPRDTQPGTVFAALAEQMQGTTLFECEGADCGRSNVWSTLVFDEPLIYGPRKYQYYRVVRDTEGQLQLLYVVRRGNRHVHALYERIADSQRTESTTTNHTGVVAALAARGMARLAVVPEVDGRLSATSVKALEALGAQFVGFGAGDVYAVCHVYRADLPRIVGGKRSERSAKTLEMSAEETVPGLLAASNRCGEAAASALRTGFSAAELSGVSADSKNRQRPETVSFQFFGVGPLQPAAGVTGGHSNRIELVVPARVLRQ